MYHTTIRSSLVESCSSLAQSIPGTAMTGSPGSPSGGSWLPLLVLVVALSIRWLLVSPSPAPIRVRRWFNLKVSSDRCLRFLYLYCLRSRQRTSGQNFVCFVSSRLFRRCLTVQKASWKQALGYRDDTIYQSGSVGRGASKSVTRQG